MQDLVQSLDGEDLFKMVVALVVGAIIVAAIVGEYLGVRVKARAKVEQVRAREESRREIAAYVAEGSMSPQDAERILTAGSPVWEKGLKKPS